jgi:hypothetical protein
VLLGVTAGREFPDSIYPLEARLVLARDFDRVLVAGNAAIAMKLGEDVTDRDVAFVWAAGASYQVHDVLRIGGETWGRTGESRRALAGPVVLLVPSSKLWLTVGTGFGLTDASAALEGRAILGIEL